MRVGGTRDGEILSQRKIVSWPVLTRRVRAARRRGKKIVFTNGCFDLVHAGHVKVFEFCRRHGDVLIVGLNGDASVRRLKGSRRPILRFHDRAALLAGFASIDFIAMFAEDTPLKLIRMIRPDVLVKGGDWKASEIVGREHAGRVVRVPMVKGQSTTRIIETIVRRYGGAKKNR